MTTHIGNDPALVFIDWSKRLPDQVSSMTVEDVALSELSDEDKKFTIFRIEAIAARREWEAAHPGGPPFAGVFLGAET